jgi:hypothetical protein
VKCHLLRPHIQFAGVIVADAVNHFLFEPTIHIRVTPLQKNFFYLDKAIRMQLAYPVFS